MKRCITYCLFAFLLGSCSSNPTELKIARKEYDSGDLEKCQTRLIRYTKNYPEDWGGWSFLGTVAIMLDNDSLANIVLPKAIALNPNDHKALTNLGIQARKSKNYEQAAIYYNKAIDIKPDYPQAYTSLVIIELKRDNFKRAVELGEKAVALSTEKDLGTKGNLALAYHFNNELSKRDALMKDLRDAGYEYVDELQMLIDGKLTLHDL